jgi:hypothetical protein
MTARASDSPQKLPPRIELEYPYLADSASDRSGHSESRSWLKILAKTGFGQLGQVLSES